MEKDFRLFSELNEKEVLTLLIAAQLSTKVEARRILRDSEKKAAEILKAR